MLIFLDSSALVKYYVTEQGSVWIRSLVNDSQNVILVSAIALAEVTAALARRQREGLFGKRFLRQSYQSFQEDLRVTFQNIPVDDAILTEAAELAIRHPLKGYDAVQIATAIAVQQRFVALTFISADKQMLRAAQAEGMQTDNPELHPNEAEQPE